MVRIRRVSWSHVHALLVGYLLQMHFGKMCLVHGFTPMAQSMERFQSRLASPPPVALAMAGNFFDDAWKNFLGDEGELSKTDNEDDDSDEYAAGEINVVTILVQEIKPGGLRLFLMFYLMGLQNTPDQGTWRANQPSTDEYVVDFWYHDNSAVLSVTLSEEHKKIAIHRVGSQPSTGYLIQESLVVQGLLDELETMATDPDVAVENRLLIPATEDAIAMARNALAFG